MLSWLRRKNEVTVVSYAYLRCRKIGICPTFLVNFTQKTTLLQEYDKKNVIFKEKYVALGNSCFNIIGFCHKQLLFQIILRVIWVH